MDAYCLTLCMLGKYSCFLVSADFFQNHLFRKNPFSNTVRVSNSLDPDQARQFVRPVLGSNCLQMLVADDTSRHSSVVLGKMNYYTWHTIRVVT